MGLSMTPWRLPDPTRWQLSTCRVGSNIVDAQLNPPDSVFTVIMNSAEASGEPRVIIRSAVRQPYAAPRQVPHMWKSAMWAQARHSC